MQSRGNRASSSSSTIKLRSRAVLEPTEAEHRPILEKLCIVMPVHNEGSTIVDTISELDTKVMRYLPNSRLLICEDGSTDDTREVLASLKRRHPWLEARTEPERKGYARAVKDALTDLDELKFDYVVFLDGDGQYDPEDFFNLWRVVEIEKPDIVVAGRRKRAEPLHRRILSSGLRFLERTLFDPAYRDVTSAFRIMKTSIAEEVASDVRFSQYNFWLEFTARAASEGYTVREVPVNYRRRDGGSRVYPLRRLPRIVLAEFGALIRTWLEYKGFELSRFLLVGLSGALIILALTFALTTKASFFYPFSVAVAFETSILWAFFLNDQWTFKLTPHLTKLHQRLLRYNTVSLIALIVNETLLLSLTEFLHFYYLTSETLAIVITFAFNYFANLRWTWHSANRQDP